MTTLLRFSQLTKTYGAKLVFEGLSAEVNYGNVIGLIGDNGAGKTTLLRILAGRETADRGRIQSFATDLRIAYLPQELTVDEAATVRGMVAQGEPQLQALEAELRETESRLSTGQGEDMERQLARYGRLQEEYERRGGYELAARVEKALRSVGLPEDCWDGPATALSGGQKTRLCLAQATVGEPNLLLLDEPTNYLDWSGLQWLEEWLLSFAGAVVLVSHDRYFLDRVTNRIWEMELHSLQSYLGNYSSYKEQAEAARQQQYEAYRRDQAEKKRLKEMIQRQMQWFSAAHSAAGQNDFARAKAKKMAARAKAVVRRLERHMEEATEKPWEKDALGISFQAPEHSSQNLLAARHVTFSYTEAPLLTGINFQLRPGERVAIAGKNGAGKTTFLRLLLGELLPQGGELYRSPSLSVAYFSQEREGLTGENSVLEEMLKVEGLGRSDAWLLLARLGFRDQEVHRLIKQLSVGQRARVSLAKLLVSSHNVLVLDEPTNHLDIRSRERIEEALQEYPGALILVSHDRYFLDVAVNQVYHLEQGELQRYLGNYSYFLTEQQVDRVQVERERQIMLLRAKMAELAAQLGQLQQEEAAYAELDAQFRELVRRLREMEAV